jgi:Tfp pilus assembly protein PilE
MDLVQFVVTVMVVTILATITLAAAAYAAFRLREKRSPGNSPLLADGPVFFERVRFFRVESPAEN